jgi:hypothetical protein
MYVNAKIIPAETIPRMGREGMEETGGRDEFKYI